MENNKQVEAPNVIIPLQHQSAPKIQLPQQQPMPAAGTTHTDGYDTEMDLPEYTNPILQQYEKQYLTKSPTKTVEKLLELHEKHMNAADTKKQRWAGQERWQGRENEEMRLVRIMHAYTFMDRLRKAGVETSIDSDRAEHVRIWLNPFVRVGRVGVNARVWNKEEKIRQARTIATLQYPYAPEYTIMRFNEWNVPTNERYHGWRTTLLSLITFDVISEAEAERAFGPAEGPAAELYRQSLYNHRAVRAGLRLE